MRKRKTHVSKTLLTTDFQAITDLVSGGEVIVHDGKRGRRAEGAEAEWAANDMPWSITLLEEHAPLEALHYIKTRMQNDRNLLANIINRGVPIVLHDAMRGAPPQGEDGPRYRDNDVPWLVRLAMDERLPLAAVLD